MDWFAQTVVTGPAVIFDQMRKGHQRLIWDVSIPEELTTLRKDVERIASDMDDPDLPPAMFWSGIPLPPAGPLPSCDYQLVISLGGTKTDFALMRFEDGRVSCLDPRTGDDVTDPEAIDGIKEASQMVTPKPGSETPDGSAFVKALVSHFARLFGPHRNALDRCEAIVMSWGFPHEVFRTGPAIAGGLTARITEMTKDQKPYSKDLEGKDVNVIFDDELRSQLGWTRPIAVANDTVMALHYFLDPRRRSGHARVGLFINGTGTNFSMAEPYAVRKEGYISSTGEKEKPYVPDRICAGRPIRPGEAEEHFFVNYESGSTRLVATKTRFDKETEYQIENNVLAGGKAFPRSFHEFTKAFLSEQSYRRLLKNWHALGNPRDECPGAKTISDIAYKVFELMDEGLFDDFESAAAIAPQFQMIARAVIARSALHVALVLAAITSRTGFGKGQGGLPDLLGMEGSIWKIPGYEGMVRTYWQALLGGARLHVDFAHEDSYNASLSGPLYLAAIHRPARKS